MQLVDNHTMRVKTVKAFTFGRQRLELAKGHRKVQVRLALLQVLSQRRRLADHVNSFGKNDARLVPFGRHAVDLGTALAVAHQHVQPDAGQECRLAVLPADQQDELPATPVASLLVDEPEHGLEQRLLPKLQPHRLPDPLALAVTAETLDELNRRRGCLQIKNPRVSWLVQLIDELLVLLPYAFRDNDLAGLDLLPIGEDVILRHHLLRRFTNAISSSASVFCLSPSGSRSMSCFTTAE